VFAGEINVHSVDPIGSINFMNIGSLMRSPDLVQRRMSIPRFAISSAIDALPWQPISPGFHLKLIRGSIDDDDTRVLVLHVAPGTVIERHRHLGEVHAFHLAGLRKLDSGRVVGPGEYLYEPPGNVDSWTAIGDAPAVIFLTVRGALEYLGGTGGVVSRTTTASLTAGYRAFVAEAAVHE
jgi:2,4'-dihydroxyacetophenone dioxygenase